MERMKRRFRGLLREVSSVIGSIENSRSSVGSLYDMDEEYFVEILFFLFLFVLFRYRDRDCGDGVDGNGDMSSMWRVVEEMFSGVKR